MGKKEREKETETETNRDGEKMEGRETGRQESRRKKEGSGGWVKEIQGKETEVKTDKRNRWLHKTQSQKSKAYKTHLPPICSLHSPSPHSPWGTGACAMTHIDRPQWWGSEETTLQPHLPHPLSHTERP